MPEKSHLLIVQDVDLARRSAMRMSQPWMLQSGCKLFVAYSKDYASGSKQLENDRELGIRIVHVSM